MLSRKARFKKMLIIAAHNKRYRLSKVLYALYGLNEDVSEEMYLRLTLKLKGYKEAAEELVDKHWSVILAKRFITKFFIYLDGRHYPKYNRSPYKLEMDLITGPFCERSREFIKQHALLSGKTKLKRVPNVNYRCEDRGVDKTLTLLDHLRPRG